MTRTGLIFSLVAAFSLAASVVGAQARDKAAAEALFNEARQLIQAGNYAEACPKLAESQKLDPAAGTLLNLADCYEHVGKTASAWATWLEAAALAKTRGQTEREELARERAAALQPELLHLTITVPEQSQVEGLSITRNGLRVRKVLWGTSMPVDPDQYTIVATAPGHVPWQTEVRVEKGAVEPTVTVPPLEPEAAEPAPTPAPAPAPPPASAAPAPSPPPPAASPPVVSSPPAPQPAPAPAAPPPDQPDDGSALRTWGYVATAVGLVGIGLGTYFALDAKSKNDKSKDHCRTDEYCTQEGVDLRDEALASGDLATAAFAIGGVSLGVATVLMVAGTPSRPGAARAPRLQLQLGGAF